MAVTKFQKGSILFGVLLLWLDQGSDIWLGVSYIQACHYKWGITTFLLSAFPSACIQISIIISEMNKILQKKTVITILLGSFQFILFHIILFILNPLMQIRILCKLSYGAMKVIVKSEENPVIIFNELKTVELVLESFPQMIFNCYIRPFLANYETEEGFLFTLQIASIVISYVSIVHGLAHRYASFWSCTLFPKLSDIILSAFIVIWDITLKWSVITLSLLLLKFNVTIIWLLGIVVFLIISNAILSNMDKDNFKFDDDYLLDSVHLILTNIPSKNKDDHSYKQLGHEKLRLKIIIQRVFLYVVFIVLLSYMTYTVLQSKYVSLKPWTYNPPEIILYDDYNNTTPLNLTFQWNCENICRANEPRIKMEELLSDQVQSGCITFDLSDDCQLDLLLKNLDLLEIDRQSISWVNAYINDKTAMDSSFKNEKYEYCSNNVNLSIEYFLIWIYITWGFLFVCVFGLILNVCNCHLSKLIKPKKSSEDTSVYSVEDIIKILKVIHKLTSLCNKISNDEQGEKMRQSIKLFFEEFTSVFDELISYQKIHNTEVKHCWKCIPSDNSVDDISITNTIDKLKYLFYKEEEMYKSLDEFKKKFKRSLDESHKSYCSNIKDIYSNVFTYRN